MRRKQAEKGRGVEAEREREKGSGGGGGERESEGGGCGREEGEGVGFGTSGAVGGYKRKSIWGDFCKQNSVIRFSLLCVEININLRVFVKKLRTWVLCTPGGMGLSIIFKK